jgi:hypothetical protein
MEQREMDADGRTLTVSSIMTRVELDDLIVGLRAAGCTEIDASEELRRIEEAERAEIIANALREAAEYRRLHAEPEDYRMPGIPIGKTLRASEMAVEEPRLLPSGHYAMPGIRVGRAMSASEKQEPRSLIVDNGTLPNGVHRMPGIRIAGNR